MEFVSLLVVTCCGGVCIKVPHNSWVKLRSFFVLERFSVTAAKGKSLNETET